MWEAARERSWLESCWIIHACAASSTTCPQGWPRLLSTWRREAWRTAADRRGRLLQVGAGWRRLSVEGHPARLGRRARRSDPSGVPGSHEPRSEDHDHRTRAALSPERRPGPPELRDDRPADDGSARRAGKDTRGIRTAV